METIKLGKTLRDSKTTLDIEVLVNGNIVATHRYNKDWHSHSITEVDSLSDEELFYIFQETKQLVNTLREKR